MEKKLGIHKFSGRIFAKTVSVLVQLFEGCFTFELYFNDYLYNNNDLILINLYIYIYIYIINIYTHIYMHIYIHIYIYTEREREIVFRTEEAGIFLRSS